MKSDGVDARQRALEVVTAFLHEQRERVSDLSPGDGHRDDGLVRELATGAVRFGRLYDALARAFLRQGNPAPELTAALRLGAHQLFGVERIPVHAALTTTVEAVKRGRRPRLAGTVNAVLRQLSKLVDPDAAPELPLPLRRLMRDAWPDDLADRHSLPGLLLNHCDHGDDDARLAALSTMPAICTRLHDTAVATAISQHEAVIRQEGRWLWWSHPRSALQQVIEPGLGVVQDRTQGRAIELARPQPGELAIDICAAPGGKAGYLRDGIGRVWAADRNIKKVKRLRRQVGQGVSVQDATQPAWPPASFDLVVVDVPCSNTGVFGRRPEAKLRYQAPVLETLQQLQGELLTAACALVHPRGRLLYATCSVSHQENQELVHAHLPSGWRLVDEHLIWPDPWHGGGYAALLAPPYHER